MYPVPHEHDVPLAELTPCAVGDGLDLVGVDRLLRRQAVDAAVAGDVEEHAAGERTGASLPPSPTVGPRSPRCSVALPPPYQWSSSPIVMWASASTCAPLCDVAVITSAM